MISAQKLFSILTRGMYPDTKDTLREYVQNGIDADAKKIYIRVRKNTITISDDGFGMDISTLRKAARIGVSDKNPGKDVGFMGIGIYSAFHLCDSLTIFSRKKNHQPCYLDMDFNGMRSILNEQNEKRLNKKIESNELMDLQTLLETNIIVGDTGEEEMPNVGTTVEMTGLNPEFIQEFSDYNILANYLREVVPLEFDKRVFKWAQLIESHINNICTEQNAKFELVKLHLQVNNEKDWLFRSYNDNEFHNSTSYEPFFYPLKSKNKFYGVIWGCINSTRNKIQNKLSRGFLIKKQGFAIGDRQKLSKYFRQVYYDRYIGEVIIVNPKLLPNAARNDFAYSNSRTIFYDLIKNAAEQFNQKAHEIQEYTLGDEQLNESISKLKDINENFSLYSKDANELIDFVIQVRLLKEKIESRLERRSIREERKTDAEKFITASIDLEKSIQGIINSLTKQTKKITKKQKETPKIVSKKLESISTSPPLNVHDYENLITLLQSLDINLVS